MEWPESLDWRTVSIIVAILLILPAMLLWRFYRGYFQILLVIILIFAALTGILYYRSLGADYRNPAIGQHAYLIESGKYLGVVEGEADDRSRGKVWVVRPPGRYPLIYSKSRVRLAVQRIDQ